MKHEYADILVAIAEGKELEVLNQSGSWTPTTHRAVLEYIAQQTTLPRNIREVPAFIEIGEFKVPKPERITPARGTRFFVPQLAFSHTGTEAYTWAGEDVDYLALHRGLVHLSCSNAETHAQALLRFTWKD